MPQVEDSRAGALLGSALYHRSRDVRTMAEEEFSQVLGQSRPVRRKAIEMGAKWPCSLHRRRRGADRRGRDTNNQD